MNGLNFNSICSDCGKCCYRTLVQDGGGDYDDMQPFCGKLRQTISSVKVDNKPCKLPPGKYYKAVIAGREIRMGC